MRSGRGTGIDLNAVAGFLVNGRPLPSIDDLVSTRLAPHAYLQLEANDARRAALRAPFIAATARHLATKAAIHALVTAWREAGIEALLLKGFYLAEFVYAHPAERGYADVDVAIRPERTREALEIARRLEWNVPWTRSESLYHHNHEEAVLTIDGVMVEMHRYVIDSLSSREDVPRKMTRVLWAGARSVAWEGTQVSLPDPVDATLVGLVLARAWSGGDRWRIKSTDYLDVAALAEHGGFDRSDLVRRATALGVDRTLDLFLGVCDPWSRRLQIGAPTRWERQSRYLTMAPERGYLSLEWLLASLGRVPGTATDAVRALPRLWAWRRRLRRDPDAVAVEGAIMPSSSTATLHEKERLVRGIKWGARLLQPSGDRCRLRSLALLEALRERGIDVRLHRGYEGGAGGWRAHLWITSTDVLLRELESEPRCKIHVLGWDPPAVGSRQHP